VDIPSHWKEHAKQICPKLKEGDMFHYNTVTGIGFMGYYVMFYIYKAYRA